MIMPRDMHLKNKLRLFTINFHRESIRCLLRHVLDALRKFVFKRPVAGIKNIITEGFAMHGQVDIVDFQSMPIRDFKYLLNYIDHCMKKLTSIPLVSKRASNVALALLQFFTEQGSPAILQADNGRDFSGSAMDTADKQVYLSDEVRLLPP